MVLVAPVPVVVTPSGFRVSVHVPVAGKEVRATLPLAVAQLGCVMVPTTGLVGVVAKAVITTFADTGETQPPALVTV